MKFKCNNLTDGDEFRIESHDIEHIFKPTNSHWDDNPIKMVLNWLPPNDEIQDAQFLTKSNLIESTYRSRKKRDHGKPYVFIQIRIRELKLPWFGSEFFCMLIISCFFTISDIETGDTRTKMIDPKLKEFLGF